MVSIPTHPSLDDSKQAFTQTKTDHLMVSEMCQAAQSHHDLRTNAPDWISRPNNTTLHCTTATDWEALSPVEQSKRHNPSSAIVITGYEVSTKFDEEGLSSLGNYRALINIHGESPLAQSPGID